jgi:RNA polymerase sigma-70 factor, ECF subfamily
MFTVGLRWVRMAVFTNGGSGAPGSGEYLLRRVGLGSSDDFAALYEMFAPAIYGLARRVVRNAGLAEDVTQEVLVTVWKQSPRFDASKGSAARWIMTIAHRRAVDRLRLETALVRRHNLVGSYTSRTTDAADIGDRLNGDRLSAELARAMGSLSDKQREALQLAYFDGLTHVEIANRLDIPLGTAKTRIRAALIALRDDPSIRAQQSWVASIDPMASMEN